jgi:hypothetical protein
MIQASLRNGGLGFSQLDLRKAYAAQGLPCPTGEQWDLLSGRLLVTGKSSPETIDFPMKIMFGFSVKSFPKKNQSNERRYLDTQWLENIGLSLSRYFSI